MTPSEVTSFVRRVQNQRRRRPGERFPKRLKREAVEIFEALCARGMSQTAAAAELTLRLHSLKRRRGNLDTTIGLSAAEESAWSTSKELGPALVQVGQLAVESGNGSSGVTLVAPSGWKLEGLTTEEGLAAIACLS